MYVHLMQWTDDAVRVSMPVCECELRCGHIRSPDVQVWAFVAISTCVRADLPCACPHTQHDVVFAADSTRNTKASCATGPGSSSLCVKDPSALPLHPPAWGRLCCHRGPQLRAGSLRRAEKPGPWVSGLGGFPGPEELLPPPGSAPGLDTPMPSLRLVLPIHALPRSLVRAPAPCSMPHHS